MNSLRIVLVLLSPTLLAQPQQAVTPVDPSPYNLPIQKIGPDDLVAVSVYGSPELTRTIRVSQDGYIRLPMLKERIRANGLMPAELEESIARALQKGELSVDPFVTVTVAEYHSRPVSVVGAVRSPVTFQALGTVTLLDALARAGGLTPEAGTEILLSRHSTTDDGLTTTLVQRIPVKTLIDAADPEVNIKLTGGEEIRVPDAGKVFVLGNVKKPGAYTAQDSGNTTVLKALALAEGLMPYAGKQAYIYRREASGTKNEIPIELKQIMNRKLPDVPLMADDILYVPDAKGTRATLAVLEKVLIFGTGVTGALIYAGVR
jgi:polysaccharide export outer membrane protein